MGTKKYHIFGSFDFPFLLCALSKFLHCISLRIFLFLSFFFLFFFFCESVFYKIYWEFICQRRTLVFFGSCLNCLWSIYFRCVVLSAKEAEDKNIALVHTRNHINLIKNISSKRFDSQRNAVAEKFNSIYFNEGSSEAARLAAGSVIEVCI